MKELTSGADGLGALGAGGAVVPGVVAGTGVVAAGVVGATLVVHMLQDELGITGGGGGGGTEVVTDGTELHMLQECSGMGVVVDLGGAGGGGGGGTEVVVHILQECSGTGGTVVVDLGGAGGAGGTVVDVHGAHFDEVVTMTGVVVSLTGVVVVVAGLVVVQMPQDSDEVVAFGVVEVKGGAGGFVLVSGIGVGESVHGDDDDH